MSVGHIHGRFQPFHDGHLEYAKWASNNCDQLIIGITNADPSHIAEEVDDPKRHKLAHNPLKYYERKRIIEMAIEQSNIETAFSISPFPINRPELWQYYIPQDVYHFILMLEEWHETKVSRLRRHGKEVKTKRKERDISGYEVRKKIATNAEWKDDVPNAVADELESIGAVSRIRELWNTESSLIQTTCSD
ncbi:adenylyltransferase/cytidyltransferase family protein [Haladaptatus cibarius]|uniref:adenylyltransferase/cytidyltransferase family protein n=1 Tax=Haladaptatus cibarius TaxID=453847 RepID=UPI0006795334|nr:adenylyltransferase/cytidyltransferase family protein [Haladaptatus cibarius]